MATDTLAAIQLLALLVPASISLACLKWALMVGRATEHDRLRFKAFAMRDELVLLAADGKIPVTASSYVYVRDLLKGILRYTHRMDSWYFAHNMRSLTEHEIAAQIRSLRDLDPAVADAIRDLAARANNLAIEILAFNSVRVRKLVGAGHSCERCRPTQRPERRQDPEPVTLTRRLQSRASQWSGQLEPAACQ